MGLNSPPATTHAVDDVSFAVGEGEVVGLVGESGSGKSTIGRMIAGLLAPTEGEILFRGRDVTARSRHTAREAALRIQMIFQDPMSSLNPRMRVRDIVAEAPLYHGLIRRSEARAFVAETLRRVGLDPTIAERYPHQFSGGQRQRIVIARALAVSPQFLICDESVAALDVSIQAQVLNLFLRLRRELGLAYLFISHDLGVVEHISDRVVILYLGRIVETAPTDAPLRRGPPPLHSGAPRRGPAPRHREAPLPPDQGRDPVPPRAAPRLPFSHPLPACRPPLSHRDPAPDPHWRPRSRLSPPRRRRRLSRIGTAGEIVDPGAGA
jgi:ABC-type oligopeptide transport system ATPase subunit